MQQPPDDFNKVLDELFTLQSIKPKAHDNPYGIDTRFFNRVMRKEWWKFIIAREYMISPREVETWTGEEVMTALAEIEINQKKLKK